MKFRNIFNLCEDAQAISSHFEGVETPEQMSSALERLRRGGAANDLLEVIQSMRLSCEAILEDTIEPGGPLDEGELPDAFEDDLLDLGDDDAPTTEPAPVPQAPGSAPVTDAPTRNEKTDGVTAQGK
jgi:hypothetical protein